MRRFRAVVSATLLLTITAGLVAASSYSLGVGSPTMSKSRVAVTVPVQVTCPALDPLYTLIGQGITVDVQQAAGKQIAHGSGSVFGHSPDQLLVVCDGAPKTINVTVLADPSGPPFNRGWMSVRANADFWAGEEAYPGCGCGTILIDEFFSVGPVDRLAR